MQLECSVIQNYHTKFWYHTLLHNLKLFVLSVKEKQLPSLVSVVFYSKY